LFNITIKQIAQDQQQEVEPTKCLCTSTQKNKRNIKTDGSYSYQTPPICSQVEPHAAIAMKYHSMFYLQNSKELVLLGGQYGRFRQGVKGQHVLFIKLPNSLWQRDSLWNSQASLVKVTSSNNPFRDITLLCHQ